MQAGDKESKLKVLLVDDDEDDYQLTKALFSDISPDRYEIEWIDSYDAAIMRRSPEDFDICLLDFRLGTYTGLELMSELRKQSYKCPMILLTGQGDREIDNMAMRAGAADYLVKGQISADNLERSVRYAIQQQRSAEERVRLTREQEAREQAEAANRAKDEFLATLSHELRTPLNVMLGWVQLLKKNGRSEEIFERAIDAIERSARAQTQLVDDLLDIARIANDTLTLTMRTFDLATVIAPAADGLRPVADGKSISLKVELTDEACIVLGDTDRLQQVVNNLLSNAIKFTPEGGSVTLALTKNGARCTISVTDTGKGIDAEFLPQIFDRYAQSKDTKQSRKGGLGLGLAIARRIVEMHGGSISAASDGEDKGATFSVELPLENE
jgi:signal transduction histidine kinase